MPTLLRSTDPGAHVLNSGDGALIELLKWALPQLGWSVAFEDEDTHRAAFRNASEWYLRVLNRGADNPVGSRVARVQAFSAMTDVDTGTGQFPSNDKNWWWHTDSSSGSSPPFAWFIFGGDRAFYIGIDWNGAGYRINFAGDLDSYYPGFTGRFGITGSSEQGTATFATYAGWFTESPSRLIVSESGGQGVFRTLRAEMSRHGVGSTTRPGTIGPPTNPNSGGMDFYKFWIRENGYTDACLPMMLLPDHDVLANVTDIEDGLFAAGESGVVSACAVRSNHSNLGTSGTIFAAPYFDKDYQWQIG